MFTPFFKKEPIKNLADAKSCNHQKYAQFFHHMIKKGFYLPPSGYEVCFISAAHNEKQIDKFIDAVLTF